MARTRFIVDDPMTRNSVHVLSRAPLETILVRANAIRGEIDLDLDDVTDRPAVTFEVPIEELDSGVPLMNDVMRSDRLKQVMQQIDPNFDERNAGFNRFSKFVVEAGNRGVVQVTRLDNGQFEVAPGTGAAVASPGAAPATAAPGPRPEGGREDGRRGRGRDWPWSGSPRN